jgi:hypothetical protein
MCLYPFYSMWDLFSYHVFSVALQESLFCMVGQGSACSVHVLGGPHSTSGTVVVIDVNSRADMQQFSWLVPVNWQQLAASPVVSVHVYWRQC